MFLERGGVLDNPSDAAVEPEHVEPDDGDGEDGGNLGAGDIPQPAQDGRKDGAANQAHNQEGRYLIGLIRLAAHGKGEHNAKKVGITDAEDADRHQGGNQTHLAEDGQKYQAQQG